MSEIFETVSAVLLSLGGGGALVVGLSSWLGKVWANRILEDEKFLHQKELEHYKSEMVKRLNSLNVNNEKALYISKSQYDMEFNIYKDIWAKLFDVIASTKSLYPIYENVPTSQEKRKEYDDIKYKRFIDTYNDYIKTINYYAPFYRDDFYNDFIEIRDLCIEIGSIFKTYTYDVHNNETFKLVRDSKITSEERKKVYIEIPKKIDLKEKEIRKNIREYLLSLQIK